jgi:hypothetical protein
MGRIRRAVFPVIEMIERVNDGGFYGEESGKLKGYSRGN